MENRQMTDKIKKHAHLRPILEEAVVDGSPVIVPVKDSNSRIVVISLHQLARRLGFTVKCATVGDNVNVWRLT
jgi:hypothetical protein